MLSRNSRADGDVLEVFVAGRGGADPPHLLAQLVVVGMVGERDVGEESAGLVLQGAELREMGDPVLRRLHVAVEHGAVGRNAELVGDAMHPEPFLTGELPLRDGGPDRRAEDLRPAAGQTGEPRLPHRQQHLALGDLLDPSQVGDLDRGQRLDVHLRVPLLQPADHIRVVAQPELGMQPTDDVELAGGHAARLLGLVEHFVQRAGVGALLLRHPREGAEHAGVPEDADVGRIDVLVGGEEHPVAVPAPVGGVGESPEAEQVGRLVERNALRGRKALTRRHLLGDGAQLGVAQAHLGGGTGHAISLRLRR